MPRKHLTQALRKLAHDADLAILNAKAEWAQYQQTLWGVRKAAHPNSKAAQDEADKAIRGWGAEWARIEHERAALAAGYAATELKIAEQK